VQALKSQLFGPGPEAPARAQASDRLDARVEARVEAVCQKGCRQVRLDIATLERGGEIPEASGLAPDERRRLLAELRQIMAVYGNACRVG
jgi:hypothetical protein